MTRMRQLLGPRLEELTGAHVGGEVPLTETVLNSIIAERLAASETPVESAVVQVRAGGEMFVRVKLRKPAFAPPVMIGARVEQQPDLPRSAVLGLQWWLPGLGVLAALAAPALSLLKAGPPWVTVDGQRVLVDLARLLREQGAAEVLTHLSSLQVGTREGAVLVRFALDVRGGETS
jgi:hypothetical protein